MVKEVARAGQDLFVLRGQSRGLSESSTNSFGGAENVGSSNNEGRRILYSQGQVTGLGHES